MNKIISVIVLALAVSAFAQADFGMKMRFRSEFQNLNSTNADKQIYDRKADLRLRPSIGYTINDYLCVKSVFEIGDIQIGNAAKGGSFGTDGVLTPGVRKPIGD